MTSVTTKKELTSAFSLEDQFAFYGSYHTNLINILIHIICVPTIFQTALILSHYFPHPSFYNLNLNYFNNNITIQFTGAFLISLSYAIYFILLDPIAGTLYAPILIGMGHFSNTFYESNPDAIKLAGIGFIAAWIAQFIGHGKFEGRAPALFNSLFQSLVLAVFFVFVEVLFFLGYRPELHKRVQNRVGKAVLAYRTENAKKVKKVQ